MGLDMGLVALIKNQRPAAYHFFHVKREMIFFERRVLPYLTNFKFYHLLKDRPPYDKVSKKKQLKLDEIEITQIRSGLRL